MNTNEYLMKFMFHIHPEDEEIILAALQEELSVQANTYQEPDWIDLQVEFYTSVAQQEDVRLQLEGLLSDLMKMEIIHIMPYTITTEKLREEDWMNHWKKYFSPILVGQKLQITPFWYPIHPDRINLMLEPKMGFGTGQHPTTFLCLEALEKENLKEKKILDLGAGSGILGVSAVLLGAEKSLLIEIDPLSVEACEDTIRRNCVQEKVQVILADVFQLLPEIQKPYDMAFINIIAEVIVDILALSWLKDIPILYLSGILENKKNKVIEALQLNQWDLIEEKQQGDWVLLKVKSTSSHNN